MIVIDLARLSIKRHINADFTIYLNAEVMKIVKQLVRLIGATSMLALLSLHLCGCRYLSNEKTQDVQFQSTPPGADISVNGVQHGATPTTVTLSRCENYNVTIRKPGYTSANVLLSRSISGSDTILSFVGAY